MISYALDMKCNSFVVGLIILALRIILLFILITDLFSPLLIFTLDHSQTHTHSYHVPAVPLPICHDAPPSVSC